MTSTRSFTSYYLVHVPHYVDHSHSKAIMDSSHVRAGLYLQELQVDNVTARPASELYSRCKLGDPKDIRLLRLLPAPPTIDADGATQPLFAHMFSGSLTELKRKYESLSYVWGSEEKPNSITIMVVERGNDTIEASMFECNITKNLWIALTDLRNLSEHWDIWTDALCINQDDIPEKNVQVAQMQDVYANSKKTMAHLGPGFERLDALTAFRDSYLTKYWFGPRPMAPDHKQRGQYILFLPERGIVRANQIPMILVMVLLRRVVLYLAYSGCLASFSRGYGHRQSLLASPLGKSGPRLNSCFSKTSSFPSRNRKCFSRLSK